MKIGIVTFHSAHNYGAVLQAWSLQEYLKQQGHEVEIVNFRLAVIDKIYRLTYRTKRQLCSVEAVNNAANTVYYKARCASYRITDPAKSEKYRKFERFIKKVLPVTKEFNNLKDLRLANLKYDVLIAGSDQIWNATMMKGINPAYFLQFGNRDALRVSYAASIGTDEVPAQYQLLFKRYLRDIDVISVREKKAKEQLQQLTDRKIDIVADPTFLLEQRDFDKLKKNPAVSGKYIYVHNVHLERVDDALNSVVEEVSQRLNLPVIHNWKTKVYKNEAGHFTGGIEEFLGYVSQAEYVITNSFHCTVFALIYQRDFITVPHFKHPDRMRNLLEELGIPEHLIGDGKKVPKDMKDLKIDYRAVEDRRQAMGMSAKAFLEDALQTKKVVDDRTYFDYEDNFRCYGCGACKDACPVDAITMEPDKEGFLYPVIDEEKCIHCDKCKKTCIYNQDSSRNKGEAEFPKVYAAYSKDKGIVENSTSGGMFTPLYKEIISRGGKVVGVKYDDEMNVVYDIAENEEACEKFRGSKYVWADSNDVKVRVKKLLKEGQHVLFTGSPCQIAGLKSYLGKSYDKLYTVELICHSASSPKAFKKYCDYLEEIYKSKITDFAFRNKFKGVNNPFVLIEFESGSIELEDATRNNFSKAFRNGYIQRPSCYVCEFASLKAGVGDITIGDYWGIEEKHPEFANDRGVSLLKINTQKGQELFEKVSENLELRESNYADAYAANHREPITMASQRARLMYYLDDKPIDDLLLTFNRSKKGGLKLD